MHRSNSIVLIDNDETFQQRFKRSWGLVNPSAPLDIFADSKAAHLHLQTTSPPLIIFCSLNLQFETGIEFKEELNKDITLRLKSIPFILMSDYLHPQIITGAYEKLIVQGFFQKPRDVEDCTELLKIIFHYWKVCALPFDQ